MRVKSWVKKFEVKEAGNTISVDIDTGLKPDGFANEEKKQLKTNVAIRGIQIAAKSSHEKADIKILVLGDKSRKDVILASCVTSLAGSAIYRQVDPSFVWDGIYCLVWYHNYSGTKADAQGQVVIELATS